MAYHFINSKGGYHYEEIIKEIDSFDNNDDLGNFYNPTYITARESIDWCNLGVQIEEKIQFLIDWKTTYVRTRKDEYRGRFINLAKHTQFIAIICKYKSLELPDILLSEYHLRADLSFLYSVANSILKPTAASKILHMYNPNLFPIWDSYMRKNMFRTSGHDPNQYVRWIHVMQDELKLMIDDTRNGFGLSSEDAIKKIKALDHPTYSLLRILDKINYNNSRIPIRKGVMEGTLATNGESNMKGGSIMTPTVKKGKVNTGLKLSEFIRDYLPGIDGFSMNKEGGFTYEEERALWQQGK